jgi:hypothetical protein
MLMKIMNQFNIKREMAISNNKKYLICIIGHCWHGGHFYLEKKEL